MPNDQISCTSVLDTMHYLAKGGADLKTMIGSFPHLNPVMIRYWMRSNGYARNGL